MILEKESCSIASQNSCNAFTACFGDAIVKSTSSSLRLIDTAMLRYFDAMKRGRDQYTI